MHPCLTSTISWRYKAWLCVPTLVYMLVAAWWHGRGSDDLTGDELYYVFATESIVDDFDVNLANNLPKHGFYTPRWNESHSVGGPHGWFSVHNIGLSALVALPWGLGGPFGARLMMAACCGLAAPLLYRAVDRVWRSPRNALLLTMALALGMPLLNASNQIYPDLLAGILLLFAADCVAGTQSAPVDGWRALFLCAALAFLPWLHIKYAAAAVVVLLWHLDATRRPRCLAAAAALSVSLGLLACYNAYAFGKMSGPYHEGNGLVVHLNSFVVFMGLHFDQSQGMFLQQPLLLLGLVGLAPMWHAARRTCLWWLLLYASAIVPNAMHPVWFGGYSFVGRFGSTNVLLWAIPLAYGARMVFGDAKRLPAMVAAFALVWQAGLASHWLRNNERLFHQPFQDPWRECIWAYNSLYPSLLKAYLPYWFPFARFWHYPANFSALLLASGALACGWFWQRRRTLAWRCFGGATLAAIVLPLAAPTKTPPAVWTGGELFGWIGREDGERRTAAEGRDERGILATTPDLFTAPGDYRVCVDYQAEATADCVGLVMFHCGDDLRALSFLKPVGGQTAQDFSLLHIPAGECGKRSSVLVWYAGRGALSVARLSVEKSVK